MFITSNMGLTAWDQSDDPYDHTQLASNFTAIDGHDHTPSKGVPIPSAGLADGSVTTNKIATNAINPVTHLPAASIPQSRLANDSVGEDQIAPNSVGMSELKDESVSFNELKDGEATFLGDTRMWYRADPAMLPPDGWEICDGRAWSAIPNAMGVGETQWTTGNIPDMRGRFIIGAALAGTGTAPGSPPAIGALVGNTGNTIDLSHSHTVAAHTHVIGSDGTHTHLLQTANRGNNNVDAVPVGDPSSYPENFAFQNHIHVVPFAGSHNHGGDTHPASPGTNVQLSATQDVRPAAIGFLIIMRVI